MNQSFHPTRAQIKAIGFGIIGAMALWCLLWVIAAAQYRNAIDNWIDAGRKAGYDIDYESRSLFGFPRHVVLRFVNLHWINTDGIRFKAGTIDIGGATLWQTHSFEAKFKNHAEIIAPLDDEARSLIMAGEEGSAMVDIESDGTWTLSKINLEQPVLGRMPDYVFRANNLHITADRPFAQPKDHHDAGLTLTSVAQNVIFPDAMPKSFGTVATDVQIDLRVMNAVPDFRHAESIDSWNKSNGIVEIDKLHMECGPLQISAKGTLGFDDDLQPEGAFISTIGKQDELLKALMDAGYIASRQETMLESAMRLLAKPKHDDGIKGIEVPIAVQLGGLFLGPVKIISFPMIEWPKGEK